MPSTLESIRQLSEALFQYSNVVEDVVRQVLQKARDLITTVAELHGGSIASSPVTVMSCAVRLLREHSFGH